MGNKEEKLQAKKVKKQQTKQALLLLWGLHTEALLETVNATAGVNQLLLASKERMAL